jgi:hypothetical protein
MAYHLTQSELHTARTANALRQALGKALGGNTTVTHNVTEGVGDLHIDVRLAPTEAETLLNLLSRIKP